MLSSVAAFVIFVLSILLSMWLERVLHRFPKRTLDDERLKGVPERIHDLRRKLAEIRGNRPSPLYAGRQLKIGKRILSELRLRMSEEEI